MATDNQIEDVLTRIFNKETTQEEGVFGQYRIPKSVLKAFGYIDHKGNWTGKGGLRSELDFNLSLHAQKEIAKEYAECVDAHLKMASMYDKYVGTFWGKTLITEEGLLQAAYLLGADRLYWGLQNENNAGILEYITYEPYEHTGPSYPEEL